MADNKQYITHIKEGGRILISEDVISTITVQALSDIEGYAGLNSKHGAELVDLIGVKNWGKGIKVVISENDEICIDCNVIVKYDHSVVAVASAIQESVANAVRAMTGIQVVNVNVNVCGVVRQ